MKFVILLSLVAVCYSSPFPVSYGPPAALGVGKNINIAEDGTITISTPAGKKVVISKAVGSPDAKYIDISVESPTGTVKNIQIDATTNEKTVSVVSPYAWDEETDREKRSPKVAVKKPKTQPEILADIFTEYQGVVDEKSFGKLLDKVDAYVQTGELDKTIVDVLRSLHDKQRADAEEAAIDPVIRRLIDASVKQQLQEQSQWGWYSPDSWQQYPLDLDQQNVGTQQNGEGIRVPSDLQNGQSLYGDVQYQPQVDPASRLSLTPLSRVGRQIGPQVGQQLPVWQPTGQQQAPLWQPTGQQQVPLWQPIDQQQLPLWQPTGQQQVPLWQPLTPWVWLPQDIQQLRQLQKQQKDLTAQIEQTKLTGNDSLVAQQQQQLTQLQQQQKQLQSQLELKRLQGSYPYPAWSGVSGQPGWPVIQPYRPTGFGGVPVPPQRVVPTVQ